MARILVVDDDELLLDVLKALLEVEGYEVHTAQSGDAALQLLGSNGYDLLVSDIRMRPMNGVELLKRVHAAYPGLPSLMITAYASQKTAKESEELGAFAYLRKPFSNEEVVDLVRRAIKSQL